MLAQRRERVRREYARRMAGMIVQMVVHRRKWVSANRLVNGARGTSVGILSWLVVGLIAGWLAGQVMGGSGFGVVGDIIVGIIGAVIGGYLASTLLNMPDAVNGINVTSIIVAAVGAVILLFVLRALGGGRRSRL